MAASDQIRQMVNFILQEAHEKANEIRVKVCVVPETEPLKIVRDVDQVPGAKGTGRRW